MAKRDEREIKVTASSGGRRLTLDPIRELPITLTIREVESTIPAGFQMAWVTGDVNGDELEVSTGSGVGSKYGTIQYQGKRYVFDVNELVENFVAAVGTKSA